MKTMGFRRPRTPGFTKGPCSNSMVLSPCTMQLLVKTTLMFKQLLHCRVYVASASQYPSRTCNCARLLIVATQSSLLKCWSQLKQALVKWQQCTWHNHCTCDKCGCTNIDIYRRRKRTVILGPASKNFLHLSIASIYWRLDWWRSRAQHISIPFICTIGSHTIVYSISNIQIQNVYDQMSLYLCLYLQEWFL